MKPATAGDPVREMRDWWRTPIIDMAPGAVPPSLHED
jgi:hypothetical protein